MLKKRPTINRELRRDQIVNATLRTIARKGMGSLTTAAIAAEADMSEANLYRHFANKEEMLLEAIERIGSGLRSNVEKVFQSPRTPIEQLRNIFFLHLTFIEKNEGIPRLVFSEEIHGGNPEFRAKILNTINTYSAKLESIVREGKAAGEIRKDVDPTAASLTMIGMLQITIFRWSLSGLSFPLAKEGRRLWRNFEHCIKQNGIRKVNSVY
ncbi:MAG: Nucleoid occlusion factor SlmA [Syntrophorhabdus sp. PtaU1.Bin050]|nr:MAG: Nucleoid occlusion factor SlmA [Syntrophorhabdus sp. PtaU1.Bin050]